MREHMGYEAARVKGAAKMPSYARRARRPAMMVPSSLTF